MNWDRLEGQWKQRRGQATHHWGKVMNDELAAIAGKYEELVGRLQERYGAEREAAKIQRIEFKKLIGQLNRSNGRLVQLQKSLRDKERANKKRMGARGLSRQHLHSKSGN